MRVFVTGATGGIGSVTVAELQRAGHQVLGLARSERSASALTAVGAEAIRGDLTDNDALRSGAEQADGVIHLAFGNDFSNLERCLAEETNAAQVFSETLVGSGKPLVWTSGTPFAPGRISTEDDPTSTTGPVGARGVNSEKILALAQEGVRSSVVRLPRSVHDQGGPYGFASILIMAAQQSGVSGYVGDGSQRWPAVHRKDAAVLFRLALEQGEPGSIWHAVGDEGDSMLSIAQAIATELRLPWQSLPADAFGPLGQIFATDQPASSKLTQERIGWRPTHPSLLADLAAGGFPQGGF